MLTWKVYCRDSHIYLYTVSKCQFLMIKCAECSIRVYRSPQLERQHETNIWEGLPCPLQFYIAVFHFKRSYCNYN